MCVDQMSLCVWSFRHVCAVGVYLFKLSPVTRYSLFWSLECRIKPQSRAATSKLTSRLPHLYLSSRAPYWVDKTHVTLWKASLRNLSLLNIIRLSPLWLTLSRHLNNTLRITCSSVFYVAVISWTSALAWAAWSQTVQTICPRGLTHSQTLHQILYSTYPLSCIIVLKSPFWAHC